MSPRPRHRTNRPKRTYYISNQRIPKRSSNSWISRHGHILVGIAAMVVAVGVFGTHLAEHYGAIDPLPGNSEDVFIGFPTAGALGLTSFVAFLWR